MGSFNVYIVLPVIILVVFAVAGLMLAPLYRGWSRALVPVGLAGLVMAGWANWKLWAVWVENGPMETAAGMVRVDGFGLFVSFILLVIGALTILASVRFLEREDADHGEFYPLVLFVLAGMFVMVHTSHLMMVLIGLEVFSVSLYVLTGLTRSRASSVESALKYFLLGAFSSGFLVYGLALLYGATGSLDMRVVSRAAANGPTTMLWVGLGLVLIGIAFKIAIVPFHHWVPDVYQGAPTNVTGFMAAATKTAAFAVLLRLLMGAFGGHSEEWVPLVTWLAILTMTVANLVALAQTNIKRLLAFSSIGHAGYLLIAVACQPEDGVRAILFYLAAYAFMTVGAFVVAAALGHGDARNERGYELQAWAGLGRRRPALAAAMSVFLFSLAGLPPTAGFLGKYVIFQAAIHSKLYLLAIVGVLNAVVGSYYYLRVVVAMWMRESEEGVVEAALPLPATMGAVVFLAVVGVFWLGLMPGKVLDLASGLSRFLV